MLFLDLFSEEETVTYTPEIENATIRLNLNAVECKHVQGPIFFRVTMMCIDTWCKNNTVVSDKRISPSKPSQLLLSNLFPYSNYQMEVKLSRHNTTDGWIDVNKEIIKTKPSCKY